MKKVNQVIKEKTTNEIYDGIRDLLIDDNPDLLTITNISKRSGYSIGNIYHHFKNIDEVLEEFIINRTKKRVDECSKMLNEFPTSATAKEIFKSLTDDGFNHVIKKLPRGMFLKLAGKIFNDPKAIKRIDEIFLKLADSAETMINKNETNTFKRLTHAEIELAILMVTNSIRKPMISNHKLALTESHKQLSVAFLMAAFAK